MQSPYKKEDEQSIKNLNMLDASAKKKFIKQKKRKTKLEMPNKKRRKKLMSKLDKQISKTKKEQLSTPALQDAKPYLKNVKESFKDKYNKK